MNIVTAKHIATTAHSNLVNQVNGGEKKTMHIMATN